MSSPEALELLSTGLSAIERKMERRLLEETCGEFEAWRALQPSSSPSGGACSADVLYSFLTLQAARCLAAIGSLRARHAEYVKRYSRATSTQEAQRHILEFSRDLGANAKQLQGDKKAFQRWFGHDAVCERSSRRLGHLERKAAFSLKRIGALASSILSRETDPLQVLSQWYRLGLEKALKPFFAYDGDSRVSKSAFSALSEALKKLPPELQERSLEENTLQFIYKCAMHPRFDVWLQCEAIFLLETVSCSSLEKVLVQRLSRPGGRDDLFVRRRAVELLGRNLTRIPKLQDLVPRVARDPSPFVRQALAGAISCGPAGLLLEWLQNLATKDDVPQVRAAAILEIPNLLKRTCLRPRLLEIMKTVLRNETDPFVLRIASHAAAKAMERLVEEKAGFALAWAQLLYAELDALHLRGASVPVKRWAAQARERIWCESTPRARALKNALSRYLQVMERGEKQCLRDSIVIGEDDDHTGRVLSVLSQEDFGFDVSRLYDEITVVRGDLFGFRLWRFLHEVKNPSPDKRQAFRHTTGRIYKGSLRVPSGILAELAETRVPGEPLFIAEEGGWRPYLPLPDDFISCLRTGSEVTRFFTSEGVTEVRPPPSRLKRLQAFWRLSRKLPEIAKLRNWRSQLQESPACYLRAMSDLGFVVRILPHRTTPEKPTSMDPDVLRFFPAGIPLAGSEIFERMKEYFVSVYANSLWDLTIFAGLATSYFIGKHLVANAAIRKSRAQIPLVVGGWGTRGKSGTERLKAALFNALGYGVVSKTTGCEAMFLYAHPFLKTREMFLFRPYDKATIWEQRNVLRLAGLLGCEVFLWECMALTPSYVEVLQKHWVRDDISTITNTYPDHEDLQGPAGINIPDVISVFIPRKARLLTSEEVMLPIVREHAREQETEVRNVTWIDSGLLTQDVLGRFPYEEHPSNVALVLALADEVGVPRDFALKEMADRVVPDLGVLKTYPVSHVAGRRLTMSNGMSANERHGTISNWLRCGFHLQDPAKEPGVWITTVVNNRADRVSRSRVFARVLVEDISADRHFLIGGNLTGLVGYIRNSWESYAPTISLWPKDSDEDPGSVLREMAKRFRQPSEKAHVVARLMAMLQGQDVSSDVQQALESCCEDLAALKEKLQAAGVRDHLEAILEHHGENLEHFKDFCALDEKLKSVPREGRNAVDAEFREVLWKWFQKKLVVVEDYYITGDQLIDLIARKTPPGYLNRIMGIQNIKGTGLDFVYRWQAWDACYKACVLLQGNDPQAAEQGLRALSAFHEYGVLCKELVRRTIEGVKKSPMAQNESFQAELAVISANFEHAMNDLDVKLKATRRKTTRKEKLIGVVEALVDAGDAVRRRKLANQVYKDLVALRISTERAALELQKLNKRQKGGWLLQRLLSARNFMARNLSGFFIRGAK